MPRHRAAGIVPVIHLQEAQADVTAAVKLDQLIVRYRRVQVIGIARAQATPVVVFCQSA